MKLPAGLALLDASAFSISSAPGAPTPLQQLLVFVEGQVPGESVVPSRVYLSRHLYEQLRDASLAVGQKLPVASPRVGPLLPAHHAVYDTNRKATPRRVSRDRTEGASR